jgi:hypothetical protein
MNNLPVLSELFDKKILKVLNLFLENKAREFHLREVAKESKVPLASAFRIVSKLIGMGVVEQIVIKKFKLLKWADNEKSRKVDLVVMGRKNPIEFFIDMIKDLEGISALILYGTPDRDGANILIIGNNVDSNEIKMSTAKTKEKFNFNVTALVLNDEQFDQMNKMGLYPKTKKIIYNKSDKLYFE